MSEALLDSRETTKGQKPATSNAKSCSVFGSSQNIGGIITTGKFLNSLRAATRNQRVIFQLNQTPLVSPGYHVTEVKAVSYDTMDCGGVAGSWRETIIQLWNPGNEVAPDYMAVQKFLSIYDRVASHVAIFDDAELRFEYGEIGRPACIYHVQNLETKRESILVNLRAPIVTCKARERPQAERDMAKTTCCG
jgi:hypothetical protein